MVDVWLEVEAHQLTPAAGPVVVECVFAPFLAEKEKETDWRTRGRRRPTAFARAGEGGATGFARAESRRRRCQVAESAYICAWRGWWRSVTSLGAVLEDSAAVDADPLTVTVFCIHVRCIR